MILAVTKKTIDFNKDIENQFRLGYNIFKISILN